MFNMTGMTKELENIIKKRAYDIAGVTDKKTKVYFNDKQVECREFEKYVDLYIGNSKETESIFRMLGWQVVSTGTTMYSHTYLMLMVYLHQEVDSCRLCV